MLAKYSGLCITAILTAIVAAGGQQPQLVDMGSYRVDTVHAGTGTPPVVFIAGLGNDVDTWSKFLPRAEKLSSVIAYSRAGLGRSTGGDKDHSANASVTELHVLLEKLGIKPPYVLVGASYGGILARLYISRYPLEVAGLVLVDASSEDQVNRYGKLDPGYPEAFRKSFENGIDKLSPGEAGERRESLKIQKAGSVDGMKPVPDIPLAVLTSMKSDPDGKFVNQTPRGYAEWRAIHNEWFLRSSNAIHITTATSGHHIQDDEPELVLSGIRFVLEKLKPTHP